MPTPLVLARRPPPTSIHRCFSSCPFKILGLKKRKKTAQTTETRGDHTTTITYAEVRTAFRQLALKHHPDTSSLNSGSSSAEFTRIKEAFDAIVEGPSGIAILRNDQQPRIDSDDSKDDVPDNTGETNYNSFQNEQNGFLHPSVNPNILHEVVDVAETMNPAGLDRGGMWQYANMIRNMAKEEGKGLPPLRVGGGDDAKESEKRVRRRRKRK